MDTDRQVRPGMKLSARHRHQLRRVLPELRSGLLDRLAFVGGLHLAKPGLFCGDLVDRPCGELRQCRLACHVSLVPVPAWPAGCGQLRFTMPRISSSIAVMSSNNSICSRSISSSFERKGRLRARPLAPPLGRRQRVHPGQHRHRCVALAPRRPGPEHKAYDRCERVTVERPDVDRPAGPAIRTINVQPRRSACDGASDRR